MSDNIRTSFEVFLIADPDGYHEVGICEGDAIQRYQDSIQDQEDAAATPRLIPLLVHVEFPSRTVHEVHVPEEAGVVVTAGFAEVAKLASEETTS